MFKLIKWLIIFGIIAAIWYLFVFFSRLEPHEVQQVKKEAIEAIDSGDISAFTKPLSEKVKEDLDRKKESLYDKLRKKLKDSVDGLF